MPIGRKNYGHRKEKLWASDQKGIGIGLVTDAYFYLYPQNVGFKPSHLTFHCPFLGNPGFSS